MLNIGSSQPVFQQDTPSPLRGIATRFLFQKCMEVFSMSTLDRAELNKEAVLSKYVYMTLHLVTH